MPGRDASPAAVPQTLHQYVYVSSASRLFAEPDLQAILTASRSLNVQHAITGVLIYAEGTFFQVLEGPSAAIDATLERIRRDKRHFDVTKMMHHDVAERSFPDWSMGYRRLSRDQARQEGWFDCGPTNPQPWKSVSNPSPGIVLARKFLSVNR
jgi:hypothetical protein